MACVNGFCTNQGCDNCVAKYTAPCGGNASGWTDNPVVAGVTDIKALHVTQMRNALDGERSRRGQTSCGLPWVNPTPGVETIQASYLNSLKLCNNGLTYYPGDGDVLTSIGDSYVIGALITALGFNNMRSAINQNEVRCTCNTDCGANDCFCACFGDCGACNYP